MTIAMNKNIHLLYVPTIYCNLGCRYCYLGELTNTDELKKDNERALETLDYAVAKFQKADVLPFNVSLHGGEASTLRTDTLGALFRFISAYYGQHKSELDVLGFNKRDPHIKTNLYNFDTYYELFVEHRVSVSASIDLPLSQHDAYRRTKSGASTLERTTENLKLLAAYPHRKKFSSTLYQVHFERIDELIADIWHIHRDLGFDMNHYNFMFGFEAELCNKKHKKEKLPDLLPLTEEQQVEFYERMKAEFTGTELETGLKNHWFEEFTPVFCTNSQNCGEKFFLLQSDGEIYSCVRGQGVKEFRYGNIFENSVEEILNAGKNRIKTVINRAGLHEDCQRCDYLYICNTGCPFVKQQQKGAKSYTCELQKAIYRDFPVQYPPLKVPEQKRAALYEYTHSNHPQRLFDVFGQKQAEGIFLPNELHSKRNELSNLIATDPILRELYSSDNFSLLVNNKLYLVESQILKTKRLLLMLSPEYRLVLKIRKDIFGMNTKELIRNTLHLQMLRDTKVTYGDEKREKQEHTFTHEVFYNMLVETSGEESEKHFHFDLMPLIRSYASTFQHQVINNLFVTTGKLREYHYQKQKENAFYHIQAINLPFPNIEFYWVE